MNTNKSIYYCANYLIIYYYYYNNICQRSTRPLTFSCHPSPSLLRVSLHFCFLLIGKFRFALTFAIDTFSQLHCFCLHNFAHLQVVALPVCFRYYLSLLLAFVCFVFTFKFYSQKFFSKIIFNFNKILNFVTETYAFNL